MTQLWYWIGNISSLFGIVAGIFMIYQGLRYLKSKRDYDRKLESLQMLRQQSDEYVVNLSGHPMDSESLSADNWLHGKKVVNIPIDVNKGMEIVTENDIVNAADTILAQIPQPVMQEIQKGSAVTFALPGMSMLAQVLIMKIHALSGVFPVVTFALRDKNVGGRFVWQKPVDFHHIRTMSRKLRTINTNLNENLHT